MWVIWLVRLTRKGWYRPWKEVIKLRKRGIEAGKRWNLNGKRLIAQADCLVQWVEL